MIEIPDPVISVESSDEITKTGVTHYTVAIMIGEVQVMREVYHDDYHNYDSPYFVDDLEDAERKLLNSFGNDLVKALRRP